ncbi:unnamed protein product [Camellia sinensis]
MMGSFGGDSGRFFLVVVVVVERSHLRRKGRERKRRSEKANGWNEVNFCSRNCMTLDILLVTCAFVCMAS